MKGESDQGIGSGAVEPSSSGGRTAREMIFEKRMARGRDEEVVVEEAVDEGKVGEIS